MPILGGPSSVFSVAGKTGIVTLTPSDTGAPRREYLHIPEIPTIGLHTEDPTALVKMILRRGFTPIWVSELIDALDGVGGLPPNPVMVIFDDGDPLWYSRTHPALMTYGFKATMAVTSDYLYQQPVAAFGNTGITWSQARTMHATGLYDWQNHTQTHTAGPTSSELAVCNAAIVSELGVPAPRGVIYPFGAFSVSTLTTATALGFRVGFAYSALDCQRPNVITRPGDNHLALNRTLDLTEPLKYARQSVIYNWENDTTGRLNAANALGYWTFSAAQAALSAGGAGGESLVIDSTAVSTALSATTTDYFFVKPTALVHSFAKLTSASQTAGTAKLSLLQYDASRSPLATIDLATVSAAQSATVADGDFTLASNCAFVRLQMITDAAYDGTFTATRWSVTVS